MNREEAFEHFKARILDKEDRGTPFLAISAYVTAGILTNADYKALSIIAYPPPPKRFKPKVPKPRLKWDTVVHGRRALVRKRKGARVVEWVDPPSEAWSRGILEDNRKAWDALSAPAPVTPKVTTVRPNVTAPRYVETAEERAEREAIVAGIIASGGRLVSEGKFR